jgi:hypothetical protein
LTVTSNGTLSVTGNGNQQLGKIVFDKFFHLSNNTEYNEIWTANIDGTNRQKINIILPSGFAIGGQGNTRLSPNGQTIFFQVDETAANKQHIYACNIDGSNPHKVIDGSNGQLSMGGAY